MDPENPLRDLFHTIASAGQARAAAAAVAATQKAHYDQLIAEGMSSEDALELTSRTSLAMFEGVAIIVQALGSNADKIGVLAEKLMAVGRQQ